MNTDTISKQIFASFKDKDARDFFASENIGTVLAAQIYSMRENRKWTQKELAEKCDMAQTRISVLEDPEYQNFNLKTLKRLASAFDVGLLVYFAPFGELAEWNGSTSPESMTVFDYDHDPYHQTLIESESESVLDSQFPTPPKALSKQEIGLSNLGSPQEEEGIIPSHRPRDEKNISKNALGVPPRPTTHGIPSLAGQS